ncbi:MAG: macro domain-containing protein [Candidatus Eisenbacteria bacterium]|uniref:Macro domain-containing protein n=1 Tax=Eiseniibacteriota bacterium TaxID=2212470 RepID=A0A933W9B5_UNCEI|nr:macro domain-containing protein [Candidatus Eisenbacteria bacterium]
MVELGANRIELLVGPGPDRDAVRLSRYPSARAFIEALHQVFATPTPGAVELVLDVPRRDARDLSIPVAFRILVGVLSAPEQALLVRVHVPSAELLGHLERSLPPGPGRIWKTTVGRIELEFVIGDVTRLEAEAIVNASNTTLTLGGGVSGSIHDAAAQGLQQEMHRIAARREIAPGDVVMTESHGLPNTKRILHAATTTGDPAIVVRAIEAALALCEQHHLASLALPALATGTGDLSLEQFVESLHVALARHAARGHAGSLSRVRVAAWTRDAFDRMVGHWLRVVGD